MPPSPNTPITPREAQLLKLSTTYQDVVAVFNTLITKYLGSGVSTFFQEEAVEMLVSRGWSRQVIFDQHLLDVETIYEDYGWEVEYDKPAYNEDGEATFTFREKKA